MLEMRFLAEALSSQRKNERLFIKESLKTLRTLRLCEKRLFYFLSLTHKALTPITSTKDCRYLDFSLFSLSCRATLQGCSFSVSARLKPCPTKALNSNCPEGAMSAGRSPGRHVVSYKSNSSQNGKNISRKVVPCCRQNAGTSTLAKKGQIIYFLKPRLKGFLGVVP